MHFKNNISKNILFLKQLKINMKILNYKYTYVDFKNYANILIPNDNEKCPIKVYMNEKSDSCL